MLVSWPDPRKLAPKQLESKGEPKLVPGSNWGAEVPFRFPPAALHPAVPFASAGTPRPMRPQQAQEGFGA